MYKNTPLLQNRSKYLPVVFNLIIQVIASETFSCSVIVRPCALPVQRELRSPSPRERRFANRIVLAGTVVIHNRTKTFHFDRTLRCESF